MKGFPLLRVSPVVALIFAAWACAGSRPKPSPELAVAVASAEPEAIAPAEVDAGTRVPSPTVELTPDRLPRGMARTRARALLDAEIDGLERLLAATPDGSPDYAKLLNRIGMDYVELSMIESVESRPAAARDARASALEYFSRAPAAPAFPDVVYMAGLMGEQAGRLDAARKAYEAVIADARADGSLRARARFGLGVIAEVSVPPDPIQARSQYAKSREALMHLGFQTPEDRELAQRAQVRLDALERRE